MGSPTSDRFEKFSDAKSRNSDVTSSSIPENGGSGDEVVEGVENSVGNVDQVNEDSPYGRNIISPEDRTSSGDEDSDSVAPPVPSISASRREHRWGDITSYAAKKVVSGFWFSFTCHGTYLKFLKIHDIVLFFDAYATILNN